MYAIVEIAGQQFKVKKGENIFVHRLANEEGAEVTFDHVLLIDNKGKISIGEPLIEGAFIEGKVLSHIKGDKVIVFKKKRRKGYQKSNGHRQLFSSVEILAVNESGKPKAAKAVVKETPESNTEQAAKVSEPKKAATEKAEVKKAVTKKAATEKAATEKPATEKAETEKAEVKKAVTKKAATEKAATEKAEAKKPVAKKPAAKKPAAKKPAAKKPAAKKTDDKKADDKSSEKDSK